MYPAKLITIPIIALYVLAAGAVVFVVEPLQRIIFPELSLFVSLVNIPAGIGIFATVLFGARAIPGLFLGAFMSTYIWENVSNTSILLMTSALSACVAWIIFEALGYLRINAYYLTLAEKLPQGENLLLAGFLTSAASAFFLTAILENTTALKSASVTMAGFVVGHFVGFLFVILLAKLTTMLFGTNNRE